ncbi:MAG: radical SAM protein [Desulfobacteraceae bacterium]|nr:radical SAM protein [Desulfobacteraceae bacterium]
MILSPSYLILMLTNQCNLACSYCYLGSQKKKADMSKKTIDQILNQILSLVNKDQNSLHVQLTGGEPFLVPHLVEYAAQKTREIFPSASIGIQTNATLMNDDVIDIIQRFNLKTGISLDGEPPVQEAQRGKAAATFKGIHLMEQRNIPFNVTTVVTKANADKLYRLVLLLGSFSMAQGIGLDPLVLKGNSKKIRVFQAKPIQIKAAIKNMVKALNMVNTHRLKPLVIREMEKLKTVKEKNNSTPFCHGAIGQSLAVTPEGKLFPCSQTAYDPDFYLGTLDHPESGKNSLDLGVYGLNHQSQDMCTDCNLNKSCPGDCPSRLYYNQNDTPELVCTIYQAFSTALESCNEII